MTGAYGVYIWPAYAAAVLILGGLAIGAALRHRAATRALARLERTR